MFQQILSLLTGALSTFKLFFLTLLFAVPSAVFLCAARMSKNKVLHTITKWFLLVIRGMPPMLQLICVYYIPGLLTDGEFTFERLTAAVIALSVNYSCYFAESYRGGIESIPRGQYEACNVLGYTKLQCFFHIIVPQVVKRIIPPMGNEIIMLIKDTSLVSIIGVVELLHIAKTASSRMVSTIPLFVAGAFYFLMNAGVQWVLTYLEKKLSYYK